jgi:hypothetical protein
MIIIKLLLISFFFGFLIKTLKVPYELILAVSFVAGIISGVTGA